MMISTTPSRASRVRLQAFRTGFTLVELLVVIGIIALLISLLLPALGRARESANSVKCQSQVRQIFIAMTLHADSHQGYMPMVGYPSNAMTPESIQDSGRRRYDYFNDGAGRFHLMTAYGALAPFMGQTISDESKAALERDLNKPTVRQLFECPSSNDDQRPGGTVWEGGECFASYAFNEAALGWGTSAVIGTTPMRSVPHQHARLRGKVTKFVNPSELVLLTDGSPRADGNWLLYCSADADMTLRDFFVTTSGPPNNPNASRNPAPGLCSSWDVIDTKRHRGRMNVGFADGHVESVPLTEGALSRVSVNVDFPAE